MKRHRNRSLEEALTVHRTVKTRRLSNDPYPAIVIAEGRILVTRTGQVFPIEQAPAVFTTEPSSTVFVKNSLLFKTEILDPAISTPNVKCKLKQVTQTHLGDRKIHQTKTPTLVYYGFVFNKNKERGGKTYDASTHAPDSRYFYFVDPSLFTKSEVPETLDAYTKFAVDVLAFISENKLKVSPHSGGLSGQLLRDARFYPDARRKVPKATNAATRTGLMGNHYQLGSSTVISRPYSATHFDQKRAHHNIARTVTMPDSDHFFAYGYFYRLEEETPPVWVDESHRKFLNFLDGRYHGLIYARVWVDDISRLPEWRHPDLVRSGENRCWLFTNELEWLHYFHSGVRVTGIYAAWLSRQPDLGLPKYAEWALTQIDSSTPERAKWLKPTLHSAYGILATKPKQVEFLFSGPEIEANSEVNVGGKFIPVKIVKPYGDRKMESGITFVVQRGMIEAEQRLRSFLFASAVEQQGFTVLSIYADSVIVEGHREPAYDPSVWKIEERRTNLRFRSRSHWTSDQGDKLPGGAASGEFMAEVNSARAVHAR